MLQHPHTHARTHTRKKEKKDKGIVINKIKVLKKTLFFEREYKALLSFVTEP